MLLFVIPMFQDIYAELGGKLPAPTQILINISNIVRKYWWLIVFGAEIGAVVLLPPLDRLRRGPQAVGTRSSCGCRSSVRSSARPRSPASRRTLSALVRSGVPILESLDIVAETSGNHVVAEAVRDTQSAVKRGEPLCAKRLEEHPVFPPMVVQMMAVGEETGALDEMLDKIADFYDQEVEATVDALDVADRADPDRRHGCLRRRHDHRALPADVQHHQAHQVTDPGRRYDR